ncbi:gephyrin-like molybdotransferase receptor GlpR [Corynebacterium sp.]|uniref:divisome protein SepX/GlpR n=1 Tax=Corynebacterium sp. TaxID=1720 RepID=UPI0037351D7B
MSGSLMIVLIVVVWLFVLAPLVFGGNSKPIRRSGEAYDETRVLHQGGTEPVQPRRRPKLTRADVRYDDEDDTRDLEIVDAEHEDEASGSTVLIDDLASKPDTVDGEVVVDGDAVAGDNEDEDIADDEVADESEGVSYSMNLLLENGEGTDEEEDTYETHESYLSPEDLGYEASKSYEQSGSTVISMVDEAADEPEDSSEPAADETYDDHEEDDVELTEEEIEFAASRRGRGSWDPVADKTHSVTRYQRRQRTFIGLCAALIVGVVFALIVGGWAWTAPVVVAALIAWYLVALRNLVRQEQELRARRVRQLRRARMGVRSSDKEAPVPPELRRPGAIIVEMDDDSPDFDHLPVTYARAQQDDDDSPSPAPQPPQRRVS